MSDIDEMLADEPLREIVCADCLDYLRGLPDASVDAVVTDPPYGLAFMGAGWDSFGKGPDAYRLAMLPVFEELLRVCKPGAHLLCFGGTRTYHRLTCAVEDSGWEVRDCLMWVYGSGMPHSLDVSKAIDKAAGAERRVVGHKRAGDKRGGNYHGASDRGVTLTLDVTEPATDDARRWEGWGTALKPAWEPVLLARAPLDGTVAANVLAHGTGAINIDASRVPSEAGEGRWPANLAHDGSEEAMAAFPEAKGQIASRRAMPRPSVNCYGSYGESAAFPKRGDEGSAARFFYCAKASSKERNKGCETLLQWEGSPELTRLLDESSQLLRDMFEYGTPNREEQECSTSWFGSDISALSQEECRFIISTVTPLITASKTSDSSPRSSINDSILDAIRTSKESGISLAGLAEKLNPSKRVSTSEETATATSVASALFAVLSQIKGLVRKGNHHATVKPLALMEWLVGMVAPPGGVVLDPFCGSGSTLVAAARLGFDFIGIDSDPRYCEIARRRVGEVVE